MRPSNAVDILGLRFGEMVVVRRVGTVKKLAIWECLCDCGNYSIVRGANLRSGAVKTCGCARKRNYSPPPRRAPSGKAVCQTPTYNTWCSMLARCRRITHKSFKDYGARGITVCDRWLKFSNFLEDMGWRPDGMTLERSDNLKGYEPGNCVWATAKQQARNRRSSRFMTAFGETKTVAEWGEDERCVPKAVQLRHRIDAGWDDLKALTTPIRFRTKRNKQ